MRTPLFRERFRRAVRRTTVVALLAPCACGGAAGDHAIVVFNAGSLARPLRAALDTFAVREGVRVEQESAGSLESARKLTELDKVPDIIALADADVFPGYLMPTHVDGYVTFARNRMVLAHTARARHAAELSSGVWWEIVTRPGVEVGRSDPELDPNGYRTLLVWQLSERHHGVAGLAERLRAASPPRNVRPKEADLVGLLQAGEFDYIWSYESMARAAGLRAVLLPREVDLSDPSLAAHYAEASVTVRGARRGEQVEFRGAPIVYAFAVPREAPHRAVAERFAAFLISVEGRAILRREGLDALEDPVPVGVRAAWMPAAPAADTSPSGTTAAP